MILTGVRVGGRGSRVHRLPRPQSSVVRAACMVFADRSCATGVRIISQRAGPRQPSRRAPGDLTGAIHAWPACVRVARMQRLPRV